MNIKPEHLFFLKNQKYYKELCKCMKIQNIRYIKHADYSQLRRQ